MAVAARSRRGRQARRRARSRPRDRPVRPGSGAERRRPGDGRRGRAPARILAAHQRGPDRAAGRCLSVGWRDRDHPGRAAGRSGREDSAAVVQHRPVEHRVAVECVRRQLHQPAVEPADPRRGGGERRPGDRVADGRLLPVERARTRVRVHPWRRDRGDGDRVHRLRDRRGDHLAGCVPTAGDSGVLPRPGALPNGSGAPPGRPESPPARRREPG